MSSENRMSQDTSPGASNTSAEEQLARKRARDRKSQKAMRDRTSWTIRSLTDQIAQLKQLLINEQDERATLQTSLDTVLQQNHQLRAENEALRRRGLEDNRRLSIASTLSQTPWEILPINVPPTCASDTIFQTFIDRRRASLTAASAPTSPISIEAAAADLNREASEGPNMNCLLNLTPCDSTNTISHVVADVMKTYAEIGTPPKQVGCFYYMAKLLAWLILRTKETYEKMPAWLRPVPIQLEQPHPAWIDRIPWPNVRDYLVRRPEITFDEYAAAYSSSLSVWWPYDPSHVVIRGTWVLVFYKDITEINTSSTSYGKVAIHRPAKSKNRCVCSSCLRFLKSLHFQIFSKTTNILPSSSHSISAPHNHQHRRHQPRLRRPLPPAEELDGRRTLPAALPRNWSPHRRSCCPRGSQNDESAQDAS